MPKVRFQYVLSTEKEADVIRFINNLRKSEKNVIFVHAMRIYMRFLGFNESAKNDPLVVSSEPVESGNSDEEVVEEKGEEYIEAEKKYMAIFNKI